MAVIHISDHILYNILARLPAGSLFRFKCVSKHWNSLIKDPYLMKLRSCPRILLSYKNLAAIDDNLHVDGTTNSVVEVSSLFGDVTIVGTFNGIVLLLLDKDLHHQLILYNPFTRVSKMLPKLSYDFFRIYTFGFGYGATMDDLKIVRLGFDWFKIFDDHCDVFSFKKSSWEEVKLSNIHDIEYRNGDAGKFLKGFLYWIGSSKLDKVVIMALNVTNMVLSKINSVQPSNEFFPLGTIDGCLCIIDESGDKGFDVWVMKEQGVESSWTKAWSVPLSIRLEGYCFSKLFPVCILDSGRILIMDIISYQLIIYYTSNGSFKKLNLSEELRHGLDRWKRDGIEYVESLVSPSNLYGTSNGFTGRQAKDVDLTGWELALVSTPSTDILPFRRGNCLYDDGAYRAAQHPVYGAPAPKPFETGNPFVTGPQTGAIVPHESNPFGPFEPPPHLMMAQPNPFVDSGFGFVPIDNTNPHTTNPFVTPLL
ncbi:putative F-box domain-containing protein [Tanacetum coccineum]